MTDLEALLTQSETNGIWSWLIGPVVAVAVFFALETVLKFVKLRLGKLAKRNTKNVFELPFAAAESVRHWFVIVVSVYAGLQLMTLPQNITHAAHIVFIVSLFLQVGLMGTAVLNEWAENYQQGKDAAVATTLGAIRVLAKLAVWSLVLILALDNLGFDITALVAGLGIGGIAIGLAAQNILSDLFASLSIALDKPFKIGDFIITGDILGVVENVGLKTTRIRSLSGEQIVISNNDLLSSRIRNYKLMEERRVVFSIGVEYGTPAAKLEKVPGIIKGIIEKQAQTRFDRCHFGKYGDFSLNYETVYYVLTSDYNQYMDIQQEINMAIYKAFEKEGLGFAFPTQTVHLVKPDGK